MAKNIAVYGIYNSRPKVEEAVEALKDAGFRNEDISVLFPEGGGNKEFAVEKGTKAPEGGATGGISGAAIGGACVTNDQALECAMDKGKSRDQIAFHTVSSSPAIVAL